MSQLNALYSAFGIDCPITVEQRGVAIEIALARQIAFSLPLPSASLEGLTKHYSETCSTLVRNKVSAFNEEFPINTARVMDLIYYVWRFRYYLVHPCSSDSKQSMELAAAALNISDAGLECLLVPAYKDLLRVEMPYQAEMAINDFLNK